jgi:hypothetical protein
VLFTSAACPVLYPSLSNKEAVGWVSLLKPVSVTAISSPVSYNPVDDEFYKGCIADVHCSRDILITTEASRKNIKDSGITLTRSIDAGHGID